MTRYIDTEKALKIIDNYAKTVTADGKAVVDAIRDIVEIITPDADVVPRAEVAREIFEEIDKTVFADIDFFKELKKKYTKGGEG